MDRQDVTEGGGAAAVRRRARRLELARFGLALALTAPAAPAAERDIEGFRATCTDDTLTCTFVAMVPSATADGYRWDLGDGTSVIAGPRWTHRYEKVGSYPIELAVVDPTGAFRSFRRTVEPRCPLRADGGGCGAGGTINAPYRLDGIVEIDLTQGGCPGEVVDGECRRLDGHGETWKIRAWHHRAYRCAYSPEDGTAPQLQTFALATRCRPGSPVECRAPDREPAPLVVWLHGGGVGAWRGADGTELGDQCGVPVDGCGLEPPTCAIEPEFTYDPEARFCDPSRWPEPLPEPCRCARDCEGRPASECPPECYADRNGNGRLDPGEYAWSDSIADDGVFSGLIDEEPPATLVSSLFSPVGLIGGRLAADGPGAHAPGDPAHAPFRILFVSGCGNDGYMGIGQPDQSNPYPDAFDLPGGEPRRLNGLLHLRAAMHWVRSALPTTHVFVGGQSAGGVGTAALATAAGYDGQHVSGGITSATITYLYWGRLPQSGCKGPGELVSNVDPENWRLLVDRGRPVMGTTHALQTAFERGDVRTPVFDLFSRNDPVTCGETVPYEGEGLLCDADGNVAPTGDLGGTFIMHQGFLDVLDAAASDPEHPAHDVASRSRGFPLCLDPEREGEPVNAGPFRCDLHPIHETDRLDVDHDFTGRRLDRATEWPANAVPVGHPEFDPARPRGFDYVGAILDWLHERMSEPPPPAPPCRPGSACAAVAGSR